jgi:hypothetical protein
MIGSSPLAKLIGDYCNATWITPESRHRSGYAADCDVIVRYGGAKPEDEHLAVIIHCVDEEIISWLEKREAKRKACKSLSKRFSGGMERGQYPALRWCSQFASKPALGFAGLHRVVPFGDNLVDVAAQLALKGADVEA